MAIAAGLVVCVGVFAACRWSMNDLNCLQGGIVAIVAGTVAGLAFDFVMRVIAAADRW